MLKYKLCDTIKLYCYSSVAYNSTAAECCAVSTCQPIPYSTEEPRETEARYFGCNRFSTIAD